ncbi:hypothetical protein EBR78_10445 [bacterium]|nr:hypothetical protein [bacterium]
MALPFLAWAALAGLNTAMSAAKAQQQARQRKAEADIRAAEIEAAPWTGRGPSTQVATSTPNIWGEMAGAGVNTLGQMAALQGSGLFSPETTATEAAATSAKPPLSEQGFEFGGMPTKFGTIGATQVPLSPEAKESVGFFNTPYENYPWDRPIWKPMVPSIYKSKK